ncbi:hypothetical protein BCR32DRAFT_286368 [Anaeromyces robustus]|uniref:Uncharacterized protein n=1 Tax=Anaeromyces robustus TaxID=1754192 RepID=A0A1Y1VYL0_9FUNG|nr:hypothetical protein BCR32DRAFT_286368 [Anaeromyces robustus]|eukprot:ORX66096.1 hypothetical protein BCR32DRAFT_286368 [Anaeromyces robustus]
MVQGINQNMKNDLLNNRINLPRTTETNLENYKGIKEVLQFEFTNNGDIINNTPDSNYHGIISLANILLSKNQFGISGTNYSYNEDEIKDIVVGREIRGIFENSGNFILVNTNSIISGIRNDLSTRYT